MPETNPEIHSVIGGSLAEACRRARITLAGGETATLPGIVTELDLSGTALGWFPAGEAITGENLEAGDVVIGLPSSGVHSNGYTLLRAIVEKSGLSLSDAAPFDTNHLGREIEGASESGATLGEVLLNPTRIYVDPIIDLIDSCRKGTGPCASGDLKAIAHITGGGLSNLLRLHDSLGWHISNPLPVPPEFNWMSETGPVEKLEMHRVFNMGMGMCIAVSATVAETVENWLAERLSGTRIVGSVYDDGHRVTHADSEIVFEHY